LRGKVSVAYGRGAVSVFATGAPPLLDPETFLIALDVEVDDMLRAEPPPPPRPGRPPSLSPSEVVALALVGQWRQFPRERAFSRSLTQRWRGLFPRLPDRRQFNRLVRAHHATLVRVGQALAAPLVDPTTRYELLDCTGVPVRNAKRRGGGWLFGLVDIGWCTRLGWFEGVRRLVAATPGGAITGFGCAPASTNDRVLAEALLAARAGRLPLPGAGRAATGTYLADSGFAGRRWVPRWAAAYGARVYAPPQRGSADRWPKPVRRWLAGARQVVETVFDRLLQPFRLATERPHTVGGLLARLAAKVGLHNFCLGLNRRHGRPLLAMADLIDW
jgi:hypothetical protein